MTTKEEALKLAEQLEDDAKYGECDWTNPKVSAAMIRRLVEELDKQKEKSDTALHTVPLSEADRNLLNSNESISQHKAVMRKNAFNQYIPMFLGNDGLSEGTLLYPSPQTKPLSDDETIQLACDTFYGLIKKEERDNFIRFAKAIEERHGIK